MSIAPGTTISSQATSSSSGGSAVALQAQLDRCTTQLGDWVNCSSGKTPEGKQIIAALQNKISSIKQQILQQTQQKTSGTDAPASQIAAPVTPPVSLALASIGSVGTILNTVA